MKIIKRSREFSRLTLLSKREAENELNNEKKIMEYIKNLPDEMINEILSFICGAPKQIIDKERERIRRQWYVKIYKESKYNFFYFSEMINKIEKKHLIRFILEGSIQKYPELLEDIIVFTKNEIFRGKSAIEQWKNGEFSVDEDRLIPFSISLEIRSFVTRFHEKVKKPEIEELNRYAHLYKSLLYVANKTKK
jgi:hypothetical protein